MKSNYMPYGHLTYVDAFNPHNYLQLLALLLEEGIETEQVLVTCYGHPTGRGPLLSTTQNSQPGCRGGSPWKYWGVVVV